MLSYIVIILIIFCVIIIFIEYMWLFILSRRRQKQNEFYNSSKDKILELYDIAYMSTTEISVEEAISEIKKYVGNNNVRMDITTDFIYEKMTEEDQSDERSLQICSRIFFEINPNKFYENLLNSSNFQKAYACKKLSMFNADEIDSKITNLIKTNNTELKYHILMSLSAIGNHDSIIKLFTDELDSNYVYSYRVIIEVLDIYSGNRLLLIEDLINNCTDYIKSIVIKAAAKYKYTELSDIYVTNLTSKDINIKIACINALGQLSDPRYEHELIIMANSNEWSVRSAAVKNLEYYKSKRSYEALLKATSDSNWWVRNNAANTLVKIDDKLVYIKNILNGYDRFAADAIKYALFKNYKI